MKNARGLPGSVFSPWVKVGAIKTPSSFSARRISAKAFSGVDRMRRALTRMITSKEPAS